MKQIDDLMKNFDQIFDKELSQSPVLTTCIAGLIEDQRETNARIDELQKRVELLEQTACNHNLKTSEEDI